MQMLRLDGKKILIMGATGNIGKATALNLSKLGANVVISGRNKEKLKEILKLIKSPFSRSVPFDIKNLSKISDFIKDIVIFDGQKLDGLVYTPAISTLLPLKNTTPEVLNELMLINFYAFIEIVRHFSNRKFSNSGSSIVVLSSYASINPDKGQLAYAASKGAIDSSIIVMAKELYSKNIRINAIRPAVVEYNTQEYSNKALELADMMKTGMIDPQNLADQIAFLLSNASSGVYGRCFDVRGYL